MKNNNNIVTENIAIYKNIIETQYKISKLKEKMNNHIQKSV